MRGGASRRSYGSTKLSSKRAMASLSMLLNGCRPERLAEFTAQRLASMFNVKPQTAKKMLEQARGRRG